MIPFNIPPYIGKEPLYLADVMSIRKLSGDGRYTDKCHQLLQAQTGAKKALLTTSCTHALEMAAILCDIQPGDEVIMPSYTFVSTANAFALRGATIVFVDIRPDTMNIDEKLIESAITNKTKAIVPVHYAGVGCEMDTIMDLSHKYNLSVIEDAAQGIGSTYKGKSLGTIGDIATFSFHETKNISCGEGGALLLNNDSYVLRAEIIREKGTNRSRFFRGEVDRYTWCDIGSSYLPSELNAAYLYAQLEATEQINKNRLDTWNYYYQSLKPITEKGDIEIAVIPPYVEHNAHMFWIKVKNLDERTKLLEFLKENGVYAVFHYIPLHSSEAGLKFGRFNGEDIYTAKESERLIRLPMYYGMAQKEKEKVADTVSSFFNKK
jgi:dTDP-4-amino-4,6-dideoxygalactose transaminase